MARGRDSAHLGVLHQLSYTLLLSRCPLEALPRQRRGNVQSKKYPQKQPGVGQATQGLFGKDSHGLSLSEVGSGEVNHGVMVTSRD